MYQVMGRVEEMTHGHFRDIAGQAGNARRQIQIQRIRPA